MVRDDAERLDRCLRSFIGVADELLVLDTGSKDDSVKVAEKNGARVLQMEWPDAFDVALNYLLDHVETEWTFRVDSDEWLAPESIPAIKAVIAEPQIFLAAIRRRDYYPENQILDLEQPRLWRTDPRMRYVGVVHEQFSQEAIDSFAETHRAVRAAIMLHHDGFLEGDRAKKVERNLRLIRKELDLRPGNLGYEIAEIDSMMELEDPEAPIRRDELTDRILKRMDVEPSVRTVANLIGAVMDAIPDDALHHPRTGKIIKYANRWFLAFPSIVWSLGNLENRRGNARAAFEYLRTLDRMGQTNQFDPSLNFDPRILTVYAWMGILQLAPRVGQENIIGPYQARLAQAQRQAQEQQRRMQQAGTQPAGQPAE